MSNKKKVKKTLEEILVILEQAIQEYKNDKTEECFKKIKKTCRTIAAFTVNPTIPPPTSRP